MSAYKEVKQLNLPEIDRKILSFWKEHHIFEQSIATREAGEPFVFYEGPPSVNGLPGIHHVMGRTIKDLYCRFHTLKGRQVHRKAGWDTHGLPIELAVEKTLGITKEDIGKTITIEEYNAQCRKEAVKFTEIWNDLTEKMGYWVDLSDPYVTFENSYIETLWWLLKQLYQKNLLYKGYTIQPYSPAAGTGLSSHELNLPGAYQEVKDTSVVAMFKVIHNQQSAFLFATPDENVRILAWTTTPWTLLSNTALTLGPEISYLKVETFNPYTAAPVSVILAKDLLHKWFTTEGESAPMQYQVHDKTLPYRIVANYTGKQLGGLDYHQLLPYGNPIEPLQGAAGAFKTITSDFVTTEDGTGIVHTAPSFGADDRRAAMNNGIGTLTLVDRQGKFIDTVGEFSGRYVKDYQNEGKNFKDVDVDIAVKLKLNGDAFNIHKYAHNYPHCWRTDKPILYYPLDSWFIRASEFRGRMAELNKTIYWKPASTGEGRFGNWLENLNDWNLSRSRYWGTPLPIWRTSDGTEEICIGAVQELKDAIEHALTSGVLTPEQTRQNEAFAVKMAAGSFDLHRPYIDYITLVSASGKPMQREPDLIDVWFDSGAMPYAQWHYPFSLASLKGQFPADFIAEGVDQTRGWFYTLHAIAVMLFDSVAFKTVVSNGLVLDKDGMKMSKRLGNAVNPFTTIEKYGADATRWYIISNSNPWDNLLFDEEKLAEGQRKFFGTLFNTYSFFALYANVDGFTYSETDIPMQERPEIDRWIISLLNSLSKQTEDLYADYEATKAARLIADFVGDHLSNWYVRLSRRRFWKGEYNADKIAAYQTLYTCLNTIAKLISPIAPFFSDWLYGNLNSVSKKETAVSVHLSQFPQANAAVIDVDLEERMQLAQDISSLVLALRKKVEIKVRQPLQKILVPILNEHQQIQLDKVKDLILAEINVKELEFITDTSGLIIKRIKPDFKKLGGRLGKNMSLVKDRLEGVKDKQGNVLTEGFTQEEIAALEKNGTCELMINNETVTISVNEVMIVSEDIPGWQVNSMNGITVALDTHISETLQNEGFARELVNRIQNLRKEQNLKVTDRIQLIIEANGQQENIRRAVTGFGGYICAETLTEKLTIAEHLETSITVEVNDFPLKVWIELYEKKS